MSPFKYIFPTILIMIKLILMYLVLNEFEVCTVSYGPRYFPSPLPLDIWRE